jgi:hypothetical protein
MKREGAKHGGAHIEGMNTRSKSSTPDKIAVSLTKNVLGVNQNILNTAESAKQEPLDEKTLGKRIILSYAHDQASIAFNVGCRKRELKSSRKDKENSRVLNTKPKIN